MIEEKEKTKAYCSLCRWFDASKNTSMGPDMTPHYAECNHPSNIDKTFRDIWHRRIPTITHKNSPQELNKDNDCKWFEAITTENSLGACIGTKALNL